MIVEQSNINMSSNYKQTQAYEKTETLTVRIGKGRRRPDPGAAPANARASMNSRNSRDSVVLSAPAKKAAAQAPDKSKPASSDDEDIALAGDLKTLIVKMLLEKLTGRKIDIKSIKDITAAQNIEFDNTTTVAAPQRHNADTTQNEDATETAVEVAYSSTETYTEQESMAYKAGGVVKTADGKEINFSVGLTLSREFMQQNNINLRADNGVTQDPLIVNFAGNAAELSKSKVAFDLNSDGQNENIHFAGAGSGFLALDSNGDGKINDGSELFGPATGNGFSELAKYDSDSNGWVDEKDPVYSALSVWTKDSAGSDNLSSLKDLGIGAINLGALSTNFAYKDEINKLKGQLKETGVFLKENGTPGTIQQIDLVT
ncbi:MAG: VCBS repeat-containing protein [Nitrospirae bacterium]|nr:VCBS repeat-containing protein [Nitrospirota bacterium]